MHQTKKVKGSASTIPIGLGIGALISLLITIAGAASTAHLVATEKIGESGIGYAAIIILFIASAMGAWCAITSVKRLRLQICLLSSAVYYLILISLTALFFGGEYSGMGVTAIVTLIGGLLVALIPGKNGMGWKRKKRAYR